MMLGTGPGVGGAGNRGGRGGRFNPGSIDGGSTDVVRGDAETLSECSAAVGSSAVRPGYCHRLNTWVRIREKRMGAQSPSHCLKKGVALSAELVSKMSCAGREVSSYSERKENER